MNSFTFVKLRTLVLALFTTFAGLAIATPVGVVERQQWGSCEKNDRMLQCLSTFNQLLANAGLPQMCSLVILQHSNGDGKFHVYDAKCSHLRSKTGKVGTHIVVDSELRWKVDLTWPTVVEGVADWYTTPDIAYSSYNLVTGGGIWACDGGFHPQNVNDPNAPSITCMPTYNQQTGDLGNPQLCSLSALQYRSGIAQYYIYNSHCKQLGGSSGQVSRHLSIGSQLPLTVELSWKEDGHTRWDTMPMLDYSYFHFDGGNATLAFAEKGNDGPVAKRQRFGRPGVSNSKAFVSYQRDFARAFSFWTQHNEGT
ncbi:hypothetical protein BDZ45DRAFT_808159 [Acephala macrosclerotiorum]|nr:hypothetical protein BDZ45DRAFT_808159 [Acephala macrosclerotiorum]